MKKLLYLNKHVKAEIDQRLKKYFDQKILAAKKIDPIYTKLLVDMQKYILRGGKRLRPTLMILGYRAAGGADVGKALDAALALEIFHNFVLIHDDVMDGDTTRYGGLNITGILCPIVVFSQNLRHVLYYDTNGKVDLQVPVI